MVFFFARNLEERFVAPDGLFYAFGSMRLRTPTGMLSLRESVGRWTAGGCRDELSIRPKSCRGEHGSGISVGY